MFNSSNTVAGQKVPSTADIQRMQAQSAADARRKQAEAQTAANRQQQQTAQSTANEQVRVANQAESDIAWMQNAFGDAASQNQDDAWSRAMQAVTSNEEAYARASSEELTRAVDTATTMQDYSDTRHFDMISMITGGRDWMTSIVGAAGQAVDDATGLADKYRGEVMNKVLDDAAKFTSTTMGNLQRMAEGFLSEGAMAQLNRTAGEVMNQLGRAGQSALYSRAAMIGQTTEEAQAQAIQLMPEAMGALGQAYQQSSDILNRPAQAAAAYTDIAMKYMNPDRVDVAGLYSQGLGARLAGSTMDPNAVYGNSLQANTSMSNAMLSNLADVRRQAASTSAGVWQFGQSQQNDLFKFGQSQGSANYFEQLQAGIQQGGDVLRHSFDMAGLRVAEQTAANSHQVSLSELAFYKKQAAAQAAVQPAAPPAAQPNIPGLGANHLPAGVLASVMARSRA